MPLRDKSNDIEDLSPGFALEDLNTGSNVNPFPMYKDSGSFPIHSDFESQLCIPGDSLDDIDMFPSFTDDLIFGSDLCLIAEREALSFGDIKPTNMKLTPKLCDHLNNGNCGIEQVDFTSIITSKKPRTKRPSGRTCSTIETLAMKKNENENWIQHMKRKCTHCQSEQTPQWREGPLGPKTLCNACGVRYKSGRLLPEYRPASSPTFDVHKHSNFHKQVVQRRSFGR